MGHGTEHHKGQGNSDLAIDAAASIASVLPRY